MIMLSKTLATIYVLRGMAKSLGLDQEAISDLYKAIESNLIMPPHTFGAFEVPPQHAVAISDYDKVIELEPETAYILRGIEKTKLDRVGSRE